MRIGDAEKPRAGTGPPGGSTAGGLTDSRQVADEGAELATAPSELLRTARLIGRAHAAPMGLQGSWDSQVALATEALCLLDGVLPFPRDMSHWNESWPN